MGVEGGVGRGVGRGRRSTLYIRGRGEGCRGGVGRRVGRRNTQYNYRG